MERPVRSMDMNILERGALDDGACRVTIAANESVRQPPELDFEGLSTDHYTRNPVVMWAHDSVGRSPSGGLPIGRTLSIAEARVYSVVEGQETLCAVALETLMPLADRADEPATENRAA